MRFSKISITSRGVELTRQEKNAGDVEDRHLNSSSEPLPSFVDALQAFRPFVVDLLELPLTFSTDEKDGKVIELLTVTTLNLSEDKYGLRGLIVTAIKPIAKAYDRPLVLNTPLVREAGELPLTDAAVLTSKMLELIKLAEGEATRFVNGERGQPKAAKKPSENAKEFDKAAAHASNQSTRKPEGARNGDGKGKQGKGEAGRGKKDNSVPFPIAKEPETLRPEEIRQLLLTVERAVDVDTIAEWSAEDRVLVIAWAEARQKEMIGQLDAAKIPTEPACLMQAATPALS